MTARSERRLVAPSLDVLVQSPLWQNQPDAERIVREAIAKTAAACPDTEGEISVVLTDDDGIRALNKQWRRIDKPTNVLSFPASKAAAPMLGDIVVAYQTLARECEDERKDFLHHLAHLCVHGFLHLIGYDHQSEAEAESMERLESAILTRLGVPDPYLDRDLRDA
ncbi:MAG: rRNA maturation RNase YbeY [Pseudolabrys sp.]